MADTHSPGDSTPNSHSPGDSTFDVYDLKVLASRSKRRQLNVLRRLEADLDDVRDLLSEIEDEPEKQIGEQAAVPNQVAESEKQVVQNQPNQGANQVAESENQVVQNQPNQGANQVAENPSHEGFWNGLGDLPSPAKTHAVLVFEEFDSLQDGGNRNDPFGIHQDFERTVTSQSLFSADPILHQSSGNAVKDELGNIEIPSTDTLIDEVDSILEVEIPSTDALIDEVDSILEVEGPRDEHEIQNAKKRLQEQEEALIALVKKVRDICERAFPAAA